MHRRSSLSAEEVLALRYHVTTEAYDRTLPGGWSEREPECWMPHGLVALAASNRHAAEVRRKLRLLTHDGPGFARAILWAAHYTYTQQRRMLEAAGYPGPEHVELAKLDGAAC